MTGETPIRTSFVGASAAPSQAPAATPHKTPRACSLLSRDVSNGMKEADVVICSLFDPLEHDEPNNQRKQGRPPVGIAQQDQPPRFRRSLFCYLHRVFLISSMSENDDGILQESSVDGELHSGTLKTKSKRPLFAWTIHDSMTRCGYEAPAPEARNYLAQRASAG